MKKLFVILLFASTLLSSDIALAQKKLSKKERIQAAVATQMLNRDLTMYITNIISDFGTDSYPEGIKVTLKEDKFTCELPYKGDASINMYGTNDFSITSENSTVDVESEFIEKKKYYQINFTFESKFDNEEFNADLKVFTNGKVFLTISSNKRSVIKYSGGLLVMI